jgi:hypothetical protein
MAAHTMIQHRKLIFTLSLAASLGGAVWAQDTNAPSVEASLDLAAASAYVWRGQVINAEAVCQPEISAQKGGWAFIVWANLDLTERAVEDAPQFTEIDLTATYARQFGPVELVVGYSEYLYPHQTLETETALDEEETESATQRGAAYPGTREVYLAADVPDWPVVPTVSVSKDIDEVGGYYFTAEMAYEQPLVADRLTLALKGSVGYANGAYNDFYFGVNREEWNDAEVGAELTWAVSDSLSLSVAARYSLLLADEIRSAADERYGADEQFIGAVIARIAF